LALSHYFSVINLVLIIWIIHIILRGFLFHFHIITWHLRTLILDMLGIIIFIFILRGFLFSFSFSYYEDSSFIFIFILRGFLFHFRPHLLFLQKSQRWIAELLTCLEGLKLSKLFSKTRAVVSIVGDSLISGQETTYGLNIQRKQPNLGLSDEILPRRFNVTTKSFDSVVFQIWCTPILSSPFWIIGQRTSKQKRVLIE